MKNPLPDKEQTINPIPGNFQQLIENIPLTRRVIEQLRSLILDNTLKPGTRLPTEPELARYLKISRSTLRTALNALELQGFIVHKRGVGTFIANKLLFTNTLNVNNGVTQLIRSKGAQPGIGEIHTAIRPASRRVAERLEIEQGTPVLSLERVRTADGKPVVLTLDFFSLTLLKTDSVEYTPANVETYLREHQSIYLFFRAKLNLEVHHAIAWLRPVTADTVSSEKLQIPIGSSVLYTEQVDYNMDDRPLVLADEFYNAEAFTFAIYRSL